MTADTVGGVWTYALELARALEPHGVQIALATMGRPLSRNQLREVKARPNIDLFESAFKLEWMEDPWRDVAAAGDWLLDLERRVAPDLVHLNGFAHGRLAWQSPKIVVGHSCVRSWWRAVHGVDAPARWQTYYEAVAAGLRAADLVVAPSRAMLAALQEHYRFEAASRVIYNGRKLPTLPPQPKQSFILSAGRLWDPAKNVAALAAVARELPWPVYVAGEAKNPAGTHTRHEQVHHLGHLAVEELALWFARAAIYALPARYEPFGLSALEAALAGCVLVLGDIPSLREIWGDAALFVPPADTCALQETLSELIASPAWRAVLSAKARASAARYSSEQMALRYLEIYREVRQQAQLNASEKRKRRGQHPRSASRVSLGRQHHNQPKEMAACGS
ncbi:MAG TPA: glycosyltransferase family 4 protein [Bacillota bacterium]|nr:glycosyltransferase family 4 protein [Bacillota bacterium]